MRIVFMGTPDYCVPTISKLLDAGHVVCGVFAQPDKPVGRKQILTPPATKVFAQSRNIPVFQPNTLRDGSAFELLKQLDPEIIVVVAYGKILPENILSLPEYGCINGHASLLPKLRGASPIQWAIVTGEKRTGVTVMQMDKGMDTGDILSVREVEILPEDTSETLFEKLSFITADLIVKAINDIETEKITPRKQNDADATYAPIINKEMAHLDFSKSADELCNAVRGFNPWPVAFCFINGRRLKVFSAKPCRNNSGCYGEVIDNNGKLVISCGNNTAIELLTVQPEGGKIMTAAEMLRGKSIDLGTVFK